MANSNYRTCLCCSKKYRYCGQCPERTPREPWMTMFHDHNCHDIWYVLSDFESGILSKDEARERMKNLDPSVIANPNALESYRKLFADANESEGTAEEVVAAEEDKTEEAPSIVDDNVEEPTTESEPEPTEVEPKANAEAEILSVSEELKRHSAKKKANKKY